MIDLSEQAQQALVAIERDDLEVAAAAVALIIEGSNKVNAAAEAMRQALEAIEFAARIDCPRTEAWANLLTTCRVALAQWDTGKL